MGPGAKKNERVVNRTADGCEKAARENIKRETGKEKAERRVGEENVENVVASRQW